LLVACCVTPEPPSHNDDSNFLQSSIDIIRRPAKPDIVIDSVLEKRPQQVAIGTDVVQRKPGLLKQLFTGPDKIRDTCLETRERLVSVEPGPVKEGTRLVKQDKVVNSTLETRLEKVTVEPGPRKEGGRVVKQDIVRDSCLESRERKASVEHAKEHRAGLTEKLLVGPDVVKDSALESHERLVSVEPTPFDEGHHLVKQDKVKDTLLERQGVEA
jgi:hypothetical protein